jgi:hypothetical protein
MSEEQQKREETEVEAHLSTNDVNDEPGDEGFDEEDAFEAHKVRPKTRPNIRMD